MPLPMGWCCVGWGEVGGSAVRWWCCHCCQRGGKAAREQDGTLPCLRPELLLPVGMEDGEGSCLLLQEEKIKERPFSPNQTLLCANTAVLQVCSYTGNLEPKAGAGFILR